MAQWVQEAAAKPADDSLEEGPQDPDGAGESCTYNAHTQVHMQVHVHTHTDRHT